MAELVSQLVLIDYYYVNKINAGSSSVGRARNILVYNFTSKEC